MAVRKPKKRGRHRSGLAARFHRKPKFDPPPAQTVNTIAPLTQDIDRATIKAKEQADTAQAVFKGNTKLYDILGPQAFVAADAVSGKDPAEQARAYRDLRDRMLLGSHTNDPATLVADAVAIAAGWVRGSDLPLPNNRGELAYPGELRAQIKADPQLLLGMPPALRELVGPDALKEADEKAIRQLAKLSGADEAKLATAFGNVEQEFYSQRKPGTSPPGVKSSILDGTARPTAPLGGTINQQPQLYAAYRSPNSAARVTRTPNSAAKR